MSSTRQGNGSSSRTVGEKRGGPGIIVKTVKNKNIPSLWQTHRGVDANFVELRCPQYKGSINCPIGVSLNTVSAHMEELIGDL